MINTNGSERDPSNGSNTSGDGIDSTRGIEVIVLPSLDWQFRGSNFLKKGKFFCCFVSWQLGMFYYDLVVSLLLLK